MSYRSYSSQSPDSFSGQLSTSLIKDVSSNPTNPYADIIKWPTNYDRFTNKTSSRSDEVVFVYDEIHQYSDFIAMTGTYVGYTYLNHRPINATSISTSLGQIATGATDLTNGIIYFKNDPGGQFTVRYFAVPDAVFGDHINALQNGLMAVQRLLGAGTLTGEGIKNASYLIENMPNSLRQLLPNAIDSRNLLADLRFSSYSASTGNTITLGNGKDSVTMDVRQLTVTNTNATHNLTGTLGDSRFDVWAVNGRVRLQSTGLNSAIGNQGGDLYGTNTVFSVGDPTTSITTGIPISLTGYRIPEERGTIARFFGSVQILGNLYTSGNIITTTIGTGEQYNIIDQTLVVQQNFRVTGNSILGATTSTTTTVNGAATIGRSLHVKSLGPDVNRFDGSIDFYNPANKNNGLGGILEEAVVPQRTNYFPDNPYYVATTTRNAPSVQSDITINRNTVIDGLDPSYLAKLLTYRALDRHGWKEDCINEGPRSGYYGSVLRLTNPSTSIFEATGGMVWPGGGYQDAYRGAGLGWNAGITGVGNNAMRWFHLGGSYYHGKFQNEFVTITGGEFSGVHHHGDAQDWIVLWTANDVSTNINPGAYKYGARVPLKKITANYRTSSPYTATGASVELSRAFSTPMSIGDTFQIYHPSNSMPNILRYVSSNVIQAYASSIEPVIANVRGIHKVIDFSCNLSIPIEYTGFNFVYFEADTPEIAKSQIQGGSILESAGQFVIAQEWAPTDSRVPIGEVYSSHPGAYAGMDPNTIRTYAYNSRYDSLWFRTQNSGNFLENTNSGEFSYHSRFYRVNATNDYRVNTTATGAIESITPYVSLTERTDVLVHDNNQWKVRINHGIGDRQKALRAKMRVFVAPNAGKEHSNNGHTQFREGPDYSMIRELEPYALNYGTNVPQYRVIQVTRNYTDLVLYDLATLPGAVIASRSGIDGSRNIALTGAFSTSEFTTQGGPAERVNPWWWTRVVIE